MSDEFRRSLATIRALQCVDLKYPPEAPGWEELWEREQRGENVFALAERTYRNEAITELVRQAERDEDHFAALVFLAGVVVRCGDPIPPAMREWMLAGLAARKPPKRRGPSVWKHVGRNMTVCRRVLDLRRQGHPDASAFKVAAGEHGLTSAAVARIWERNSHIILP